MTQIGIPHGRYIGRPVNGTDCETDIIKCEACGGWIDCRDLGSVMDHIGPLPHPDRTQ